MKNIGLILFFLSFLPLSSFCQRVIEIKYEQDSRGNYQFYCNNNGYCSYIIEINFTSLSNGKSDHEFPYRNAVKPGRTNLFKLTKENMDKSVQFKYTTNFNKGCIHPNVDTNFTYLLPIAPGKEAQAYELTNAGNKNVDPASKNWYVIRLKMKPGDTICAARRGVVCEIEDNSNLNDSGVSSVGHENYLEIAQADCSIGHYGVLRKNSTLVKLGQTVEAGQPIGLVGGDKYGRGSDVRFSVYYNPDEDNGPTSEGKKEVVWTYINLNFWTKNNGKGKLKHGATYISEHPAAIINQEKSKTETKKRQAQQKSKSK